jgi:aspartyl-tRNA(Asn)/glutamyl-tRNA(Gln) amidotransferase subunit C
VIALVRFDLSVITMSLSSQDIARIANLARLELSPLESERLLVQTNDFFNIVEKMRAVDTTGITPLAHPLDTIQAMTLRLRDDVASEPNNREANQQTAPAVENGLFLVPKVIE